MISSISRVSFGDNALGAHQALIESPGKFSVRNQQSVSQPSMAPEQPADAPKKHSALKVIGGIVGAVVLGAAALFGLSKCVKVKHDTTNVFRKGINKLVEWGESIGKLFSKKGAEDAADAAGNLGDNAGDKAGEQISNIFA